MSNAMWLTYSLTGGDNVKRSYRVIPRLTRHPITRELYEVWAGYSRTFAMWALQVRYAWECSGLEWGEACKESDVLMGCLHKEENALHKIALRGVKEGARRQDSALREHLSRHGAAPPRRCRVAGAQARRGSQERS